MLRLSFCSRKMNYTINYPNSGATIPAQITNGGSQSGQRAIILSQPSQSCLSNTNQGNSSSANTSSFPVVMQVGSSNALFFYAYQNCEGLVNSSIHNKSNDNSIPANNNIGQVLISPVSPAQNNLNIHTNGSSPTVNITPENKPSASKSLSDLFNLQGTPGIQGTGTFVQTNSVPGGVAVGGHNTGQQSPDVTKLLSTLQVAGLHVVESPNSGNSGNMISAPVMSNNNVQSSDVNLDKNAMANFISSLQASGVQVIENSSDKTVSILLPNQAVEDKCFGGENIYKIVDGIGNVSVLASKSDTTEQQRRVVSATGVTGITKNQPEAEK